MDLHRHLTKARARPKRPFTRTTFTVVSALVRDYKLDESFLQDLGDFSIQGMDWLSYEPQAKEPFAPPLFSLVPEAEYRLTQAILSAVANPYVQFAHSPAELLLAEPLFRLNSGIEPALLAWVHFRTLLAREIIRSEREDLRQRLEKDPRRDDECAEPENRSGAVTPSTETRGRLASLEGLLDRLDAFIDQQCHTLHEHIGSST